MTDIGQSSGARTAPVVLITGAGANSSRPIRESAAVHMTPDGAPLVGPSGVANLWLNVGHGSTR